MNKKAFTLTEILTVIVIIAIILGIVFPTISKIVNDNKEDMYKDYEKMMVEYAKLSDLKDQNIILLSELDELDKIKRECTGYVSINHSSTPIEYKAYISCDNVYKTAGYDNSIA